MLASTVYGRRGGEPCRRCGSDATSTRSTTLQGERMRRSLSWVVALSWGCGTIAPFDPGPDGGADGTTTVDPCAPVVCPPDSVCEDGACTARDPCAGLDCPAGYV